MSQLRFKNFGASQVQGWAPLHYTFIDLDSQLKLVDLTLPVPENSAMFSIAFNSLILSGFLRISLFLNTKSNKQSQTNIQSLNSHQIIARKLLVAWRSNNNFFERYQMISSNRSHKWQLHTCTIIAQNFENLSAENSCPWLPANNDYILACLIDAVKNIFLKHCILNKLNYIVKVITFTRQFK